MELRHLRYFAAVAEEQNVTRAARRLHVSQPPLSRQIHDLEAELGVELFRRTARSLALTAAGKMFLIEARGVLARADQAIEAVRKVARGDRGSMRIGYAPSLTSRVLPHALRLLEVRRPGVRVALHDLSSEECLRRVLAGRLDLALTVAPARRPRGLLFEKLRSYPFRCAVGMSHRLARRKSVSLAELRPEKFVIFSREDYPEYYSWLCGVFADRPFDISRVEEYDGATGLIAAVEAGRGVAIVASSMACLAGPRLRLLPVRPPLGDVVMGALTAVRRSILADDFVACLRTAAKEESRT